MARPTKYTPEVVKRFIDAVKLGATYELAAAYAGIGERTFYEWQVRYPQFQQQVKAAEGAAAVGWLARIEQAASKGTWQAAAWKLERRYPERYGRTVSDHHITDHRKEAEAIAAEIGKADDPAVVEQIARDLVISQEAR